jgi:hypothetical protein
LPALRNCRIRRPARAGEVRAGEVRAREVRVIEIERLAVVPGIPASDDSDGRLYVRARPAPWGFSAWLIIG